MAKPQVQKKVVADPDVKSKLAGGAVVKISVNGAPPKSSSEKSDYENHPKFAKFKKSEE